MADFKEVLKSKTDEVNSIIEQFAFKEEGYQKRVFEAMNYSFIAPGKRLRPMIVLETYRLFGGNDIKTVAPFMAAIEMIHTYSLIHDDLPAMDNDDYRRGRLTNHKVFDEATAILAGDGLLNAAFETMSNAMVEC
ncbi:MAG: polyprenyl synthetase family protein, partial [Lachnospiraceae bacterium]|nr:polyprenyl synthetase family protein [Lachnospiraceae bacterium]